MAQALAAAPHQPPRRTSAPYLALTYDGYRLIAPRHDTALWSDTDSPFTAEFFAAGFLYEYPVEISTVDEAGVVTPLRADGQWFQFRGETEPLAQDPGGFSGFRMLTRFPGEENRTEFLVFQGASYFRARGQHNWYGSSARGLAVDVGLHSPEEFPRFIKFWIVRPKPEAQQIEIWALMDSPGTSGAYRFLVTPGESTAIDVNASVWVRHGLQKLAVAPLTSMWMWDANNRAADDPRPEVHDSDGLLIHADDQWTWRPLRRPATPQVTSWPVNRIRGFGLLQRDRELAHYQDSEAHYDRRPSMWVTPANNWGPGRVELLELPSEHEGGDNIGAYWLGEKPPKAGARFDLAYRVSFGDAVERSNVAWRVVDTRTRESADGSVAVAVTYQSTSELGGGIVLEPRVQCEGGKVEQVELAPGGKSQRVVRFRLLPAEGKASHLRVQLRDDAAPVSELWSYRWQPN